MHRCGARGRGEGTMRKTKQLDPLSRPSLFEVLLQHHTPQWKIWPGPHLCSLLPARGWIAKDVQSQGQGQLTDQEPREEGEMMFTPQRTCWCLGDPMHRSHLHSHWGQAAQTNQDPSWKGFKGESQTTGYGNST